MALKLRNLQAEISQGLHFSTYLGAVDGVMWTRARVAKGSAEEWHLVVVSSLI